MDKNIAFTAACVKIDELGEQVKTLQNQIESLMDIFGFCGYVDGFIRDNNDGIHITTGAFKRLDYSKLPLHMEDFNLLLDYLKVSIQDEKVERKIIPRKIVHTK